MAIERQYGGERLEEATNPDRKTIRYLVTGEPNSTDAIAELKTVIDIGDADPDGSTGMIARRFNASERLGSGADMGFIVDVEFTRSGITIGGDQIPDQDASYRLVDLTSENRRFIAPVFVRRQVAIADPAGASVVIDDEWAREDREFEQESLILRVTCNQVGSAYLGTNFDQVIAPQMNKVHQLYASSSGLNRWRFIGANASQVNSDTFRITYEWEQDRGTIVTEAFDGATQVSDKGQWSGNSARYIVLPIDRTPYHDWVAYTQPLPGPIASGAVYEPIIRERRVYEEDLTGANAFPGNPKAALA
jgi:hypothetical protein